MNDIKIKAVATGRTAYAVVPDPDDPIILQIDGKLSRVVDISAGGFTMPPGIVPAGRRYPFSLDLPSAARPIAGYVDALPGAADENVQCAFVNLSNEESDTIHHYVLMRQKQAIRAIRSSGSPVSGY